MKKTHLVHSFALIRRMSKTLLIMKLTFAIILALSLQASAKTFSQEKISISFKDVKLEKALKEIEQKSSYRFAYSSLNLPQDLKVTFRGVEIPVKDVLDALLNNTGLGYHFMENKLIVISAVGKEHELFRKITGTITDEKGMPLEGVTVQQKASLKVTKSNAEGVFALDVDDDAKYLVFSHVGMQTLEVEIAGRTSLQIKMKNNETGLNEVVVIGYGTQKKVNLTGSVSTMSTKAIENLPTSNITNALAGRVSGLYASQTSGAPGTGSSIVIRGKSTFNGTAPLYVIDGIARPAADFAALSPTEIESISILKDATAAAVYGSRAANGVILVTTKHGNSGTPVFNYNGFAGTEKPTQIPERTNAADHPIWRNRVAAFNLWPLSDPRYYTADEIEYFKTSPSYDWLEGAWHDPVFTQHDLSVSGGSEKIRYFSSLGYYYQKGAFTNLNYSRYNIRSNVDATIAKNLKMGLMLDASFQNRSRPYWPYDNNDDVMNDLYRGLLNKPPIMPWKIGDNYVRAYQQWNPIALIDNSGKRKWNKNTFNGIIKLDYKLPGIDGLAANVTFNYRKYYIYDKTVRRKYPVSEFKTAGGHNHILTDTVINSLLLGDWENSAYASFTQSNSYTLDASLSYTKTFQKHTISALALYEQYEGTGDYLYGFRNKLLGSDIDQLFIGENNSTYKDATGNATEGGRLSYVGRLNYGYDNKYLFEANFRYDASLKFAPQGRWSFFPSVSAGWRMSEENFIKNNFSFIDNLKLRASYGLLGNDGGDDIADYGYMDKYSATSGAAFGVATSGIIPGAIPNYKFTWEKTAITDIGLEFTLWRGLLSMEIDYFKKHTYDILGARVVSIPNTFGATLPNENYGVVNNHGIEIIARHENTLGNGIRYFINGNFSFARNIVKKWDVAPGAYDYQQPVGRPMKYIAGYEANGIARTDKDLNGLPTYNGNKWSLGDIILKDNYKDDNIDSKDQVVLSRKSIDPEIIYGFTLGGNWKGFDLNIFFQGVANRKIMFPNRADIWDENAILKIFMDSWTPETPNATYPRIGGIGASSIGASRTASSFWLMDCGYMRLKNLELGYTISKKALGKSGINNLRIYISGANLLTFSKFKISDPETVSGPYGVYQYPQMKSYNAGLSVRF